MEIKIDFAKPPRRGRSTTLLRWHTDDRADVNKAARRLGMTAAEFMRTAIIQAARSVLASGATNGNKTADQSREA